MKNFYPNYLRLLNSGELKNRVEAAYKHLSICDVCAVNCPVDRLSGNLGACRTGIHAKVNSFGAHHGEEAPLSGWMGSGTIFFTRCNLRCQYCQNFDISQADSGDEVKPEDVSVMMLRLQAQGCHNINFVSPSHVVPQILAAVWVAAEAGLHIPLVYNTGGYDSLPMLKLLDGVIDIYMPDMKYGDSDIARKYSKISDYTLVNQAAVKEMHQQVGDLQLDEDGLATHGLLVRHLVLPHNLAGTEKITKFLANEISKDTYINIMDQYHPCYKANQYPELMRRISSQEYYYALDTAKDAGLSRLDRVV
jgi:putative pyruvate formate lyase activating enzyme